MLWAIATINVREISRPASVNCTQDARRFLEWGLRSTNPCFSRVSM